MWQHLLGTYKLLSLITPGFLYLLRLVEVLGQTDFHLHITCKRGISVHRAPQRSCSSRSTDILQIILLLPWLLKQHLYRRARLPWPFLTASISLTHLLDNSRVKRTDTNGADISTQIQLSSGAKQLLHKPPKSEKKSPLKPWKQPAKSIKTKVCTHQMEVPYLSWFVCLHWPCRPLPPFKECFLNPPFPPTIRCKNMKVWLLQCEKGCVDAR